MQLLSFTWAPAGILARGGKVYLLPFLSFPSPLSPFFSPHIPPPLPFFPLSTLLFFSAVKRIPLKDLWERCKLSSVVQDRAPAAVAI